MKDEGKTKEQLIQELVSLRRQIAILKASEIQIKEEEVVIQEPKEKYRVMVDNAGEGIIVAQDGMVVYANPHVMEVTGYSLEELSSKPFVEFIHPEDREMVLEYHIKRLKGEKVAPVYIFRNIDKEGNIRWIETNVVMINWDGIPASLIFLKDVTEQKKAEKALKESEEKYATLVEKGNDGIVILQDGLLKFGNSKMVEITGFSVEEGLETPFIDYFSPEYKELVMERYKMKIAGDEISSRHEAELLSKNGMRIPVEINASRIEYEGRPADMAIIRDITERKQAEKALKKLEHEKAVILDSISEDVLYRDKQMRILWANRAAGESAGLTPEQLVGQNCYELWRQRDKLCEECPAKKALETGKPQEIETTTPDGRVWFVRNYPVQDAKGDIVGVVEVTMDITKHKQAEKALRKSEERYRSLVENINDVIFTLDSQGRFTYISPVIEQLFCYKTDEIIGQHFSSFVHPEDLPGLLNSLERTLAGQLKPYEFRVLNKEGFVRYIRTSSRPLLEEDQLIGLTGIMTDITERKLIEQKLKESEKRYRGLYESSIDGIASTDMEGNIIDCNQSLVTMLGYTKEELCGMKYQNLTPSKWHKPLTRILSEQIIPRGYTDEYETEAFKKDGSLIAVSCRSWLIKDKEGNPAGIWAIVRDITERKKLESQLKKSEERYRRLFESSLDGIVFFDMEGRVVDCNQAIMNMIGYTKEELYNVSYTTLIPNKWHDMVAKAIIEGNPRGHSKEIELEAFKKDGTIFPISVKGWPIKDVNGNPAGLWGIVRDITERKKMEKQLKDYTENLEKLVEERTVELKESESQYRTTLDSMGDMIHVVDSDLRFILINTAFKQLNRELGIETDVIGKKLIDIFDFLSDKVIDEYYQVFETGETLITEEYTTFEDREFITETRKIPIFSEGKVTQVVTVMRDITERKQAEEKVKEYAENLKETEARYRSLYESSIDGIISTDLKGNIVEVNQVVAYRLGYSTEELYNLVFYDIVPSKWHNKVLEIVFGKIFTQGYSDEFEIEALRKDGIIFPISVRMWLIKDKEGNATGLWGIIRDITERKRAEEALSESEAKYSTIVEQGNDGIVIAQDGVIKFVNPKILELANSSLEDLLGKPFIDFIAPEYRESVLDRHKARMSGKEISKYETEILLKDGRKKPVEINANVIEYEGRPATLAILRDITERKKLDQMKSQFINVAAHELRTPLSALKAHLDLLKIKAERGYWQLPNEVTEKLNIIARNADRLTLLTNNLLDYTRLEAGTVKMKLELNSLDTVIVKVIEEVLPLVKKHKHKIDLITPEMLTLLDIDKELIHRVFSNLITNAIKYTPDGGKISVKIVEDDVNLHITVEDTGIGISKDDLEKIFQPFHVSDIPDSARFQSEFERTGLGLAISKEYVKMHGGTIWAESQLGEGSTFHVTLPKK